MLNRFDLIFGSDRPAGVISKQSQFKDCLPFEIGGGVDKPGTWAAGVHFRNRQGIYPEARWIIPYAMQ